jgi:membrane protein
MLLRRVRILVFRSVKAFFDDSCSQRAAALSYYVLFSLFPLIIFSVGVIGLFLQDNALQADIVDEIMNNIPLSQDQGRSDVTDALQRVAQDRSGAIGFIGLVGLAWSGSAMFGVLRSSMNVMFHVQRPRPPLISKLFDLGIVLSFTPFFVLSIAATSLLRVAQRTSEDIPILGGWAEALGFGWLIASFLLPVAISFVAFFLVYWLVPAQRVRPRYLVPGALLAAVLFEVVKIGFNVYLENFSNYDVVFGSLGAVVAFLFWVYLSANIMLLGAELASETPGVASGRYDTRQGPPGPNRPLTEKVLRLARSLILHPPKDVPGAPPAGASTEEEERKAESGA